MTLLDDPLIDEASGTVATIAPDGRDEDVTGEDEDVKGFAVVRRVIPVLPPVVGAAVMVSGVFQGLQARLSTAVAGLLGVAVALLLRRVRSAPAVNLLVPVGIFAIGVVLVVPSDPSAVGELGSLVRKAAASGDLLRPPVPFTAGWQAISAWIMALVGFVATWIVVVIRRPALGLLSTLPVSGIAAVALADSAKLASGLAGVVLFIIGLGLLSAAEAAESMATRPSLTYELGRAAKSLPLLAVGIGLVFGLTRVGLLFPPPVIDPQNEAQKPKTVPLSAVADRVLFEVTDTSVTGPWRMGALDVYDGKDWRLPPFSQTRLAEVPRSGILEKGREPGLRATITVAGLSGGVLPSLPSPVGIVARGPKLAFDRRTDTLRVAQGQVVAGFAYSVTAAVLPTEEQLRAAPPETDPALRSFVDMPPAPAGVQAVIDQVPPGSLWERFDRLRTLVLDTVTASGSGVPVSVTPERVQELLTGPSPEGTPFEIVAAQAMLARWIGLPARVGYGFDGGEKVGETLQVRPRHGAVFVEVHFPGQGWLPVIGTPLKAKPTLGGDADQQRTDENVLPSNELTARLVLPVVVPPRSTALATLRTVVVTAVAVAVALSATWLASIPIAKRRRRLRLRAVARSVGPRARVAVAYGEWRDTATDLGFGHPGDTPLAFLARVVPDDEHKTLAWIATRCLWGDLAGECTDEHAIFAEELSKSLRRRLGAAQPTTMRLAAVFSRRSVVEPWNGHRRARARRRLSFRPAVRRVRHAPA